MKFGQETPRSNAARVPALVDEALALRAAPRRAAQGRLRGRHQREPRRAVRERRPEPALRLLGLARELRGLLLRREPARGRAQTPQKVLDVVVGAAVVSPVPERAPVAPRVDAPVDGRRGPRERVVAAVRKVGQRGSRERADLAVAPAPRLGALAEPEEQGRRAVHGRRRRRRRRVAAEGRRVERVVERVDLALGPGQDKSDSTSLQRECSARLFRKKHPRFEIVPRDDRPSKNQPKRVENGRARSL